MLYILNAYQATNMSGGNLATMTGGNLATNMTEWQLSYRLNLDNFAEV